jgi:ABC-2 type transport system permease protein
MFGAVFLGVVISYFIFFSLSSIAFWTPEIWAPRFVFFVLISGLAGGYYPLDIFPKAIYYALLFSPFPYLVYLPAKIYIEGISLSLLPLFTGALFWAMLSIILARAIWRKGLAEYSFFGR